MLDKILGFEHYKRLHRWITFTHLYGDANVLPDCPSRAGDPAQWTELRTLRGHTAHVYSNSFSPDGSRVGTASQDDTAKMWDVAGDGAAGRVVR